MAQIEAFQMGAKEGGLLILVVILLLLLPPILVELMDFNGHIPQLRDVKSLKNKQEKNVTKKPKSNNVHVLLRGLLPYKLH